MQQRADQALIPWRRRPLGARDEEHMSWRPQAEQCSILRVRAPHRFVPFASEAESAPQDQLVGLLANTLNTRAEPQVLSGDRARQPPPAFHQARVAGRSSGPNVLGLYWRVDGSPVDVHVHDGRCGTRND